jgi:very-short-patch-repair endonuclease
MLKTNLPQESQKLNSTQQHSIAVNSRPEPSYIENRLIAALEQIGLFNYERQYEIDGKYADIAFPSARLVVECDGYPYHHTREDRDRDSLRDLNFEALGWRVLRCAGSLINRDAIACALKIKEVYQQQITMLNVAVSKSLCAESTFPQYVD